MRIGSTLLVLLALIACIAAAPADNPVAAPVPAAPGAVTAAGKAADEPELLAAEAEVAKLINEYRVKNGLAPLKLNAALCRAARAHSADMARKNNLSHVLDGKGPGDRAKGEGFDGPISENCAGGSRNTPRSFFQLWVGSKGHRANMLGRRAGVMGVGFARTKKGDVDYYTAMFAPSR